MNLELVTHTARAAMAQDLGKKVDGQKTLLEHELLRTQGAVGALKQVIAIIDKLAGPEAKPWPVEDKLAQARVEALDEAAVDVAELSVTAKQNCVALAGQIAACEGSLDVCQAAFEGEIRGVRLVEAAIEAELQAAKTGKPAVAAKKARRKAGEHPGPSLKKARNSGKK